jgi:hypothetical protein
MLLMIATYAGVEPDEIPIPTISQLRVALARHITEDNMQTILKDYILTANQHESPEIAARYKMITSLEELRAYVGSSRHYVTGEDISYLMSLFNVVPVILNHNYKNEKLLERMNALPVNRRGGLLMEYESHFRLSELPKKYQLDDAMYIVILHSGNHYDLLLDSENTKGICGYVV